MQEIIRKGRNDSGEQILNYLAKSGKVYLMDNHGAAFWCWSREVDPMRDYWFIHIDRHHDLEKRFVREAFHEFRSLNFAELTIDEVLAMQVNGEQILRWDNFIELFKVFYPFTLTDWEFVTPEELPREYEHFKQTDIRSWLIEPVDERTRLHAAVGNISPLILNLDVDVFYTDGNKSQFVLSDEAFDLFVEKLKWYIDLADIVTIALSPECCGSWENSLKTFSELNRRLDLGFDAITI